MRERSGSVWYEDHRVGSLRSDSRGAIHFRYDPEWLEGGFPISLQLPLAQGDAEVNAHGFFQGLLPEGRSRQRVCRRMRIDPNDDAGLMLAIGEDCAGALSIVTDERAPDAGTTPPEEIADEAIRTLIRARGEHASAILDAPQRFSLAGALEKLPVICEAGRFLQPNRNHPSTHILKFETHRHVCFAEYLTLHLAKALGFDVVDCSYSLLEDADDDIPYLIIARYDRQRDDDGNVHRLHQEDMIQALGYETDFKYQGQGGAGLDAVITLLTRETGNPPEQIRRVIDWQIFNYLVGNYDAHGKNLSLLYGNTGALPELAPFYDLVSIEFINQAGNAGYSREMAFAIGGQYVPERVSKSTWDQFAADLRVRPTLIFRRVKEIAQALPDLSSSARRSFAEQFGDKPLYDQYERAISDRCRWVLQVIG